MNCIRERNAQDSAPASKSEAACCSEGRVAEGFESSLSSKSDLDIGSMVRKLRSRAALCARQRIMGFTFYIGELRVFFPYDSIYPEQ